MNNTSPDIELNNGRIFKNALKGQIKSTIDNDTKYSVIYCEDEQAITSDEYNEYALKLAEVVAHGSEEQQMVDLLTYKLNKEEFYQLFELMDRDEVSGSLFEAIGKKAEELCPENFLFGIKRCE